MDADKAKARFYRPDQCNNDIVFLQMIEAAVKPGMRVLDAGAGAGDLFPYNFKDTVEEMVGADLDPRVEENPRLHRGIKCDLAEIPCEDETFDLVFSRYVLEHVADPDGFLKEMARIIKPGGSLLFLTPNKWHYVSLGARLTPNGFHGWYNKLRGRDEEDTFPTVYKLNSISDCRREFDKVGFDETELVMRECCPNYLTFSWPTFLAGVAYERLVNSSALFKGLRVNLLGHYTKRG